MKKFTDKINESIDGSNNLPSAWEFITNYPGHLTGDVDDETLMIEFAKLHVEAALKAASEDAHTKDVPYTDDVEVDKDSILNAYPLENIK
jgi:hypothetical protein